MDGQTPGNLLEFWIFALLGYVALPNFPLQPLELMRLKMGVDVVRQMDMAAVHLGVALQGRIAALLRIPALSLVGFAVKATSPAQVGGIAALREPAIPMADNAAKRGTIAHRGISVCL